MIYQRKRRFDLQFGKEPWYAGTQIGDKDGKAVITVFYNNKGEPILPEHWRTQVTFVRIGTLIQTSTRTGVG